MKTIIRLFSSFFGFFNKFKTSFPPVSDTDIGDPDEVWFANDTTHKTYGRIISMRPEKVRELGLKYCGSGSYASVYKVGEAVVKTAIDTDPAYQNFLRLALKRQNNPFFPKVFAVGFHCGRHIVVMERLGPLPRDGGLLPVLGQESPIKTLKRKTVRDAYMKNKKAFRQLVNDLKTLCIDHDYDLHGDNVMLRGSQLVVIDPVC